MSKVFNLYNQNLSVGILRLGEQNLRWTINGNYFNTQGVLWYNNCYFVVSSGENFERSLSGVTGDNFSFGVFFANRFLGGYPKNLSPTHIQNMLNCLANSAAQNMHNEINEPRLSETDRYDDEKIAEENYYLLEGENAANNYNAQTKNKDCKEQGKEPSESGVCQDETGPVISEKFGYKPVNERERLNFENKIDAKIHFFKLTFGRPRESHLEQMIENSDFYLVGDKKPYYFGRIFYQDKVYFAYAVKGDRKSSPQGFKNAYYIPKSYFELETGYYCLFQLVE